MSDPYRPGQPGWQGSEPTQPATYRYPPYTDPAYAGQTPTYGPGYPYASRPHEPLPHGQPPPAEPPARGSEPPPPEPPKSPKWLWLLAGAAVLLVAGLVIALVIANGSSDKSATISPATPTTKAGARAPTTTRAPSTTTAPPTGGTSPTETTESGATDSVVYDVTGEGRAISIIYLGVNGDMQSEFNVPLPWSKDVSLSSSLPPSVNVTSLGEEVTCTITVNGAQVSKRTGSIMTMCTGDQ